VRWSRLLAVVFAAGLLQQTVLLLRRARHATLS
jgi:hypothetical protein